ncbi:helix-turn-helix domain-containing protein [Methylobacterium isbiliense]|nr:helix-turn-helix transcriptional regulator [Methylobacterium isbiliense]
MGNNLKTLRERKGWTVEDAASAMGLSKSGYEKIENGSRRLTLERIARAAQIYQVPQSDVINDRTNTGVVGEVVRGGRVRFFSPETPTLLVAPAPFDATIDTVALVVTDGDALPGVAEERWFVYHGTRRHGLPEDWIGDLCVVGLPDNVVLVRRPFHGRRAGTYDLFTLGTEPLLGTEIIWSAKIDWIKPR